MTDSRTSKERVCVVCRQPWALGHRCKPTPSTERDEAIAIANRLLDEPMADPDDDLRTLARQFMRAVERASHEPPADEQIDHAIRRIEECELSMDDSEGLVSMLRELKRLRAAQPPCPGRYHVTLNDQGASHADFLVWDGGIGKRASEKDALELAAVLNATTPYSTATKPAARCQCDTPVPAMDDCTCANCGSALGEESAP